MEIKVRYLGGKRFEMSARGHSVVSDQPFENDGADSAMTPPELFLSSLGACAGFYASEYLRARGLDTESLEVRVSGKKGEKPVRITSIDVEVSVPGLSERDREGIVRAVNRCLLKQTLLVPPQIEVRLTTGALDNEPILVG